MPGLELPYTSDGAAPDTEVSGRTSQVYRGLEVRLRCDVGLAQPNSSCCVLPDAAAVYVLSRGDTSVAEAAQHIFEAQNNPDSSKRSPGKWKMKSGTRAVADASVTGVDALQRAKSLVVQDANRKSSCSLASSLYNTRLPLNQSAACNAGTQVCSCDEYPFAST